jgi:hypothetical protein
VYSKACCWQPRSVSVFAVLPTGFGKSLIYQVLPTLFSELHRLCHGTVKNFVVAVVIPLEFIRVQQVERTKLFASVRLNRETELLKVPWILSLKSKMHTLRTSHVHENIKTNNPTWNHIEMNIFIFFVFIFVQWNLQHLSIILYDCVYCLKITCGHPGFHLRISSREANLLLFKGALQSDLRMCKKEPTFYDTNSLTMFWVLAKPDCCFLIIYYTLEAWI